MVARAESSAASKYADRRIVERGRGIPFLIACLLFAARCTAPSPSTLAPAPAPIFSPAPTEAESPAPPTSLDVTVLYPKENTEVEMGQPLKFIARVTDMQGGARSDAQATIQVRDPEGKTIAAISTSSDKEGTFRSDAWAVPHRTLEGKWTFTVDAKTGSGRGSSSASFEVKYSTSEALLNKYGFWLDAPTLKGIVPQLYAEKGDAHNGLIRWGGFIPAGHILPENDVEMQWREGNYTLDDPASVRRFMLEQLGDLGITKIRDIGTISSMPFKQWSAWRVAVRGEFGYEDLQYVILYAPEVNKTYAIGTTVVLPPPNLDAHAFLRSSFAVVPDIQAAGVAPDPLPRLAPAPVLLDPPLGARFQGPSQSIVLHWSPVKKLAQDEYYEVAVDYNYGETTPGVRYATRETQFVLPQALYGTPNCQVFNWQVTLKRQTGVDEKGQPVGDSLSYNSLYRYVMWSYPPGDEQPFTTLCFNEQF